jgi:hypothetical protein
MRPMREAFVRSLLFVSFTFILASHVVAQDATVFQPADVFELEFAADPQISPEGDEVV